MKKIILFLSISTMVPIFGWKYRNLEEKMWDLKREKGIIERDLKFHKERYVLLGEKGYMWRHVDPLSTKCDDSIICKLLFLPVDIVTVPVFTMIGIGDWAVNMQKNAQELQSYENRLQKIEEEIKKTDEEIHVNELRQLHGQCVQE